MSKGKLRGETFKFWSIRELSNLFGRQADRVKVNKKLICYYLNHSYDIGYLEALKDVYTDYLKCANEPKEVLLGEIILRYHSKGNDLRDNDHTFIPVDLDELTRACIQEMEIMKNV